MNDIRGLWHLERDDQDPAENTTTEQRNEDVAEYAVAGQQTPFSVATELADHIRLLREEIRHAARANNQADLANLSTQLVNSISLYSELIADGHA